MKANQISANELPVINVRANVGAVQRIEFKDLAGRGMRGYAYGINVGDVVEMPDTEADCILNEIPIRKNGPKQVVVAVLKNGKPAWLGVSGLARRDADNKPVHPVAEYLMAQKSSQDLVDDLQSTLALCLGKTITATEVIPYQTPVFDEGGQRTTDTKPQTTAKLIFAE